MKALIVFFGLALHTFLFGFFLLSGTWWGVMLSSVCLILTLINIRFRIKWGFWP